MATKGKRGVKKDSNTLSLIGGKMNGNGLNLKEKIVLAHIAF